ncbi:sigma-70 family RNA polymerase sigma factor [Streptomyces thinghirensis]|nr:sigma-70 family RNA polymerase sigma factor [Streptomyces thinghirensis]
MRLVRRRLPSFQDAEDCVQETMARAAAHAALDRNRLGAFLTSVALRLCIDFYRDMERRSRLLQRAALAETPGTTEEDVCDEDFGRWLLGQVQHLRGREQEVILARAKGSFHCGIRPHTQHLRQGGRSRLHQGAAHD